MRWGVAGCLLIVPSVKQRKDGLLGGLYFTYIGVEDGLGGIEKMRMKTKTKKHDGGLEHYIPRRAAQD